MLQIKKEIQRKEQRIRPRCSPAPITKLHYVADILLNTLQKAVQVQVSSLREITSDVVAYINKNKQIKTKENHYKSSQV